MTSRSASLPSSSVDQADARWFSEEVRPHEPALRAWLQSRFPDLSEVDDIVQESYLRVLRARRNGPIASAKNYLFAVARNAALAVFRRRKFSAAEPVNELEASCILGETNDVAETVSTRQEFVLAIEAIGALPARCREIVVLRTVHGLAHKEIALQLGLSEQTVRVQVARGMKKCAEFLRQRGVTGRNDHGLF